MVGNLVRVQHELAETRADLKAVERENLHFTVKFLGEVPEGIVEEVDARLRGLAPAAFEVVVRGVGAFPDPRRPRVVWAGVSRESQPAIEGAASAYAGALEGLGRPEDHGFHAHITLARVRSPANADRLASFIGRNGLRDLGRTMVTRLKLKSSVLSPTGPSYTDLREYALA